MTVDPFTRDNAVVRHSIRGVSRVRDEEVVGSNPATPTKAEGPDSNTRVRAFVVPGRDQLPIMSNFSHGPMTVRFAISGAPPPASAVTSRLFAADRRLIDPSEFGIRV